MSRRGRTNPAISLFAFQDIITSVTAIIIVMVLFLALDLVQRHPGRAADSAEDSAGALAEELRQRISEATAELAELQAAAAVADELVRDVAAISPVELAEEIERRRQAIADLQARKQRLEEQQQRWKGRQTTAAAEAFDLRDVHEEQAQVQREITEFERQREQERRENRPVFSLPRGFDKTGWLVVVEADRLSLAPLQRASRPRQFVRSGIGPFGTSAVTAFLDWVRTEQQTGAYFLLLVRPSGSETFADLTVELGTRGITYGFDLIDAHRTILDPERGAAP